MVCACAHGLKIGPQSRRLAVNPVMASTAKPRNGRCARRRVSEANRGNAPALRPEIDRSLQSWTLGPF